MEKVKLPNYMIIIVFTIISIHCQYNGTENTEKTTLRKDFIMDIITSDTLYLRWDKPVDTNRIISGYSLFYRVHNSNEWIVIKKDIPANDSPFVLIKRKELDTTEHLFDFSVSAFFEGGDSSDVSLSTDSTVAAHKGWFVKWQTGYTGNF